MFFVLAHRTEAKDHLRREGIGIALEVTVKCIRLDQKLCEHLLVFQFLVGDVGLGGADIQYAMNATAQRPPCLPVWLWV